MRAITVLDEPCGTGKTSRMIASLDPVKNYLIVVPYLSEVDRVIRQADGIDLYQPDESSVPERTKHAHLRQLLEEGKSVVATHALYENAVPVVREGLLEGYHIIIDEVLDAAEVIASKSPQSVQDFYIQTNYLCLEDNGRVRTSWNWLQHGNQAKDTLDARIFSAADHGRLFLESGSNFITGIPEELLSAGQSLTIMTFMFAGSLLKAYLNKLGIPYDVKRDPKAELHFKQEARRLIDIRTIPALEKLCLTYTGQGKGLQQRNYQSRFGNALKNLRDRELNGLAHKDILITTRQDLWFRKGDRIANIAGPCGKKSRLFSANWIANTTRGTNDYSHCSNLLYLYDQHVNPTIARWLSVPAGKFSEQYALTELIQWVWRSRIRNGKPIILYLPNNRMRRILQSYLRLQ